MLYLADYLNTNETPEDGPEMHHVDRPNKDSSRGAAGGIQAPPSRPGRARW